ncbi:MAG: tRNA-specific 2-thiouridylase MnmA [Candidatus Azambacteria bacterium GW2011_GWA2_42_62]|nr:MAG: tRNA-specific 2-thiouridylase MnmA [Candidatus Azambacteria bacterium GW2011_GWA2_42_62]
MSGGVDSSVAALLLSKNPEYDMVGIYMKGWSLTDCAEQDATDARRAAGALNVPFYVFDFEEEYKKRVVDYMISGYATGDTPNPDVMCNKEIKFGLFLKKALALGADYIATGHYTRLCREILNSKSQIPNKSKIKKFKHLNIENSIKPQVRALAKKYQLPTAEKPDSQGVCFVGEIDVAGFLKEKLGKNPGPIKTMDGRIIGTHDGVIFYTIGQRKGIGIKGSLPGEQGKIYFVAAKDIDSNTLWVAEGESEKLFSKELVVKNINWIYGTAPKFPLKCLARIRYRQPLQSCLIKINGNLSYPNDRFYSINVVFDNPQRAITPGQSAVFYDKSGAMLGGGVIV